MLGLLTGGWQRWAAIGAVIACMGLYIAWLRWDNDVLARDKAAAVAALEVAAQVNAENEAARARMHLEAERAAAASRQAIASAQRRAARAESIMTDILNVQGPNDPVGPRMRAVIERLREPAEGADPRGGRAPAGAP